MTSLARQLLVGEFPNEAPTAVAERLRRTLHRAFNAPYYREIWGRVPTSVLDLPILSRADVKEHADALLVGDVPRVLRRRVSTGGSSGSPLAVWLDHSIRLSERRYMTTQWARVGYRRGHSRAVLRGRSVAESAAEPMIRRDSLRRTVHLSTRQLSDSTVPQYVEALWRARPRFLHAYPSAAERLARLARAAGLKLPPFDALLLGSEAISEQQRQWLQRAMGCRAYSWYGLTEKVALAGECEYSTDYHVWESYGQVELIDASGALVAEAGTPGRIVATGFLNASAPLVRYDTGDIGEWAEGDCACGFAGRRLARVLGRAQDVVPLPNGAEVSIAYLNLHDEATRHVRQLQYVVEPDEIVLRVLPAEGYNESSERDLLASLRPRVAPARLRVEVVHELERMPNGKTPQVIRRDVAARAPGDDR